MQPPSTETDEYLTIIAPSAEQAMAQFRARDLGAQGYAIAGRIGRHSIALVEGAQSRELFCGQGMVAATFSRKVPA